MNTMEESVERRALVQLELALNGMPDHEKLDYVEALRRAPELVASESDPIRFLRYTNYNASAAAQVLTKYWKQRRRIFGDKEAFLPMLLTGNGALSPDVIECFKSGQLMVLPPDTHGRIVRYSDQSRLVEKRPDVRSKSTFYNGQLLSEEPGSQTKGLVMLVPIYQIENFDVLCMENVKMLLDCFPIKVHSWHAFNCVPSWETNSFSTIMKFIEEMFGKLYLGTPFFIHERRGENKFMEVLQTHGLERNSVPEVLGGDWSYERDFTQWLYKRGIRDLELQQSMSRTLASKTVGLASAQLETSCEASAKKQDCCKKSSDGSMVFVQNWKQEVEKALLALPSDETAAYRAALAKAPYEVKKQGVGADLFLRTEYFNARLAAKRLARYWRLREETFGPKKFLPLHQTGEGALGRKEIKVLREGCLSLLPSDANNRPVLWVEPSRSLEGKKSLREGRNRCLFYMFSIMTENTKAQSDGVVVILRPDLLHSSRVEVGVMESLTHSLPLRTKVVHLLTSGDDALPDVIREKASFAEKVYIHQGDTGLKLGSLLQSFGLKKAGLPKSLHGNWGHEKFAQWLEIRTRMEFQIPQAIGTSCMDAFSFPGIKPYALLPENEKEKYSRRMNVVHCRRKRDRTKFLVGTLEEDGLQLKETRDMLEEENKRLRGLMVSAKRIVSLSEESIDIKKDQDRGLPLPEDGALFKSFAVSRSSTHGVFQERPVQSECIGNTYGLANERAAPGGQRQMASWEQKKPSEDTKPSDLIFKPSKEYLGKSHGQQTERSSCDRLPACREDVMVAANALHILSSSGIEASLASTRCVPGSLGIFSTAGPHQQRQRAGQGSREKSEISQTETRADRSLVQAQNLCAQDETQRLYRRLVEEVQARLRRETGGV